MNRGAIILCGGRSARMGRDKATLRFGSETLLERVVRIVAEVVPPRRIVCIAAQDQLLPSLPAGIRIARDPHPDRGPLAGFAAGLDELGGAVEIAFLCGCDAPLVLPAYIERMFELCGRHHAAVVDDGERLHPLCAVYRTEVRTAAEKLLAAGSRSMTALVEACETIHVGPERLRDVDPDLNSLIACNTPEEFARAFSRADVVD